MEKYKERSKQTNLFWAVDPCGETGKAIWKVGWGLDIFNRQNTVKRSECFIQTIPGFQRPICKWNAGLTRGWEN